jgi:NAD(P)-dependent dehydrogenase (short-subunit alcohol dehydrogenase family)
MKNFKGKVAVVTGGAGGIGLALARVFARKGMKVVLADVEVSALRAAERELRDAGCEVLAVRTDVSKVASVQRLADLTAKRFGNVHILCNNAGILPPERHKPLWETPLQDWKWALDVNLWGVIHGIHCFLPAMLSHGERGHVVSTASIAGLISGSGSGAYGVAKHGVVRLSEGVYASLRERRAKIGATVLCPGVVATGIFNSERNRPGAADVVKAKKQTPHSRKVQDLFKTAMQPDQVAEQVLEAIRGEHLFAITTTAFDDAIRERMDAQLQRRNPKYLDLLTLSKRDSSKTT